MRDRIRPCTGLVDKLRLPPAAPATSDFVISASAACSPTLGLTAAQVERNEDRIRHLRGRHRRICVAALNTTNSTDGRRHRPSKGFDQIVAAVSGKTKGR